MIKENNYPIRIGRLLVEVLRRWRVLLALFVLGLMLGTVFAYFKSQNTHEISTPIIKSFDELDENLSDEEKQLCYSAMMLKAKVRYAFQSNQMKLNPESVPTTTVAIGIVTQDGYARNIASIYTHFIKDGSFATYISENYPEYDDLSQLVTIDSELSTSLKFQSDANQNRYDVYINVRYYSEEECKKLGDYLIEYIEDKKDEIQKEYGDFDLKLLDRSFSNVYDEDLLENQITVAEESQVEKNSYINRCSEMTDDMRVYYCYLVEKYRTADETVTAWEELKAGNASTQPQTQTFDVKLIILAALGSLAVAIAITVLCCLMDGKLREAEDWKNILGIDSLGSIRVKKTLGGLDKCVDRLDKSMRSSDTIANAIELLISEGDRVGFLMLQEKNNASEGIFNDITAAIGDGYASYELIDNVYRDNNSLENLKHVDKVILFQKEGKCSLEQLNEVICFMRNIRKDVLGGIIIR